MKFSLEQTNQAGRLGLWQGCGRDSAPAEMLGEEGSLIFNFLTVSSELCTNNSLYLNLTAIPIQVLMTLCVLYF